ncbi:uncharacterized protein GGS22DRAFT_181612 [Annulohypoxylon maeteangense]|uniref:uncharacterized protein n=1 Tax=Annulohypoxylon maeteangense TaxID=1927788 RepID=UPI002007E391|nr:uncharacterized protein GGS22DRAFT_181612 [Annulohypoxylon maeteangense]KAI0881449.1 hypothetical protein GGS22DRAFT_181612 [Annulohypoxylon maeteangense]
MGRSNKDRLIREPRTLRHQQARHLHGGPPMYPQPQSPHVATYSLNGANYFPHPCSYRGKSSDSRYGNSDGSGLGSRSKPSSKLEGEGNSTSPVSKTSNSRTNESIGAELKVSLAAKHLADQISESKKYWVKFQKNFEEEVAGIRYYVGDDILQQIWQKRIEYNSKYKNGETKDDEEFSIQRMKLETCLDQVDQAAKAFTRSRQTNDRSNHDPRHLALDKIHGVGALVLKLATKSALNSASCVDLVTEASNLEKLVNLKSPDAQVLHQFDKRKAKGAVSGHGNESANSNDPTSREAVELLNQEIMIETESKEGGAWC